jgi:predicted aspartyl protease
MPSFTQRISNLQQVGPVVELVITPSLPFLQTLNISPASTTAAKVLAMIDTGATGTVIQTGIAHQLGINPIGTTYIHTPSSMNVLCHQFDVRLIFPSNVGMDSIVVTEAPLQGQHIQCLIGRDVLQHGVLIYTGYDDSFTLSF